MQSIYINFNIISESSFEVLLVSINTFFLAKQDTVRWNIRIIRGILILDPAGLLYFMQTSGGEMEQSLRLKPETKRGGVTPYFLFH